MKAIFITALATICLLAKQGLAYDNIEYVGFDQNQNNYVQNNANSADYVVNNNEYQLNQNNVQNNATPDNNANSFDSVLNEVVDNYINTLENNENANNNVQPNQFIQDNTPTQPIQPTQPVQPVQPIQPIQPIQPVQPVQPVQPQQEIIESIPGSSSNNEDSGNTAYILGGVGFTGMAFIAVFGYKNYRKSSELNKLKEEFLTENGSITKPEKAKRSNTLTRLSRSLSLSFISRDDVYIDDKPVVSESIYADNYSLTKNRAYKCHVAWTPLASDEIILRRGDLVCVKESFKDGYSLGRNLSTKFDGIFPTCCLATPNNQIMGSELIKNGKFVSILRRSFSKNKAKRSRRASSVSAVITS